MKAYNGNTPPLVPLRARVVRPTGGPRASGERERKRGRERSEGGGASLELTPATRGFGAKREG